MKYTTLMRPVILYKSDSWPLKIIDENTFFDAVNKNIVEDL